MKVDVVGRDCRTRTLNSKLSLHLPASTLAIETSQ